MTENDVIEILRNYLYTQFPKRCACCGKVYKSLEEYLRNTTHMGKPVSYDGDEGNWKPIKQMGTVSLANCTCGTTLAISSHGMGLSTMWKVMRWARKEKKNRGITLSVLLEDLREKIDKSVLQNEKEK